MEKQAGCRATSSKSHTELPDRLRERERVGEQARPRLGGKKKFAATAASSSKDLVKKLSKAKPS